MPGVVASSPVVRGPFKQHYDNCSSDDVGKQPSKQSTVVPEERSEQSTMESDSNGEELSSRSGDSRSLDLFDDPPSHTKGLTALKLAQVNSQANLKKEVPSPTQVSVVHDVVQAFTSWCLMHQELPEYDDMPREMKEKLDRVAQIISSVSGAAAQTASAVLWQKVKAGHRAEAQ